MRRSIFAPRTRLPLLSTVAAASAALLVHGADARAQTPGGWYLDRFEPSAPGDTFFAAEDASTSRSTVAGRAAIIGDYANAPLVRRYTGAGAPPPQAIIDSMLVAHVQLGVSLLDRVLVSASLPVTLLESGSSGAGGADQASAYNSAAVGDPRVGLRLRIFGRPTIDPIALHFGAYAYLGFWGVSSAATFSTDRGFGARAYLGASGRLGALRYALDVGYRYRDVTGVENVHIGSEIYATAAVGYASDDDRLVIGPEAWFATQADQAFKNAYTYGEIALGLHYRLADTLMVGAGVAAGLTQGVGTPDFRGLIQLAYAPSDREPAPPAPADTDADGVIDPDDQCPAVPSGVHPDPARRGCPEGDRDHDTVLDSADACPDEPQGDHPDPHRAGCPEGDRDHDTVLDSLDQCPDEPRGDHPDPHREGCPDRDSDGDGVLDSLDQCPAQPAGPLPDPNRPGCPAPDRDGDNVPDATDHCPDQPGAPSADPQRNGCPGLVRLQGTELRILTPVYFATNRDVILARSFPVLNAVADALRASPQVRRVAIEGHTDDAGPDARNMDLSRRRAESVRRWLVEHDIEGDRLSAEGFGETRPVRDVTGLRGRALRDARAVNRRVEFRIVDPAPASDPQTPPAAQP